ncbi:MAG: short-chain dehydrogenase, partial [Chloroflexota bacterium]
DGTRLRGSAGQPGLYQRRGRLVLEGKRLNQIYAALIQSHKAKGQAIEDFLKLLDTNNPGELSAEAPAPLQKLAASLVAKGDAVSAGGATLLQKQVSDTGSAYRFFMNPTIARKLVTRLELGSYLKDKVASQQWLEQLPVAPDPFFTPAEIEKEANKIKEGTLAMLNLNRMPTEQDVALATIYYLADRNVSGETFQPSGGLRFDRTVTEGELFGKPTPNRLEKLNSRTIFLIGEYMELPLERLAHSYLDEHQVGRIIILTHTQERANEYAKHFDSYAQQGRFHARPIGNELEAGLEAAIRDFDRPLACVSTPFIPLTQKRLIGKDENSWEGVFDEKDFAELCENQLTHHFRIARKMSLVDGVQIVLVTPETSRTTAPEGFGLANFVKTSLHALTVTLGVESERNVHQIPVNQVNLARRAHSEEPTDLSEEEEELTRFVNAVLLMTSTPLPDATISRYRSRIYRGNAITI